MRHESGLLTGGGGPLGWPPRSLISGLSGGGLKDGSGAGVATGRADVWMEAQAKPWDLAPLQIIAEEAGCAAFDFDGNDTIYVGNYVICVPALADEIKRFTGTRDHPLS